MKSRIFSILNIALLSFVSVALCNDDTAIPILESDVTSTSAATTKATTSSTTKQLVKDKAEDATEAEQNKKYFISDELPTCHQQDSQFNECIKSAFEVMIPRFKNGLKELNIPPIDPFSLNRTVFSYELGPVSGRLTMRRAQAFGFAHVRIKEVDFKIKNDNTTRFHMLAFVPLLIAAGDYKADVALNNIRLKPRGTFNVTMSNVTFNMRANGSLYEKDGHTFLRILELDLLPQIDGLLFDATGLTADQTLNELILDIINQYWREIFRAMLPEALQYLSPVLLRIFNESLSVLPFEFIVPNNGS